MNWDIDFISKEDFRDHIKNTLREYGDNLNPYDIEKFNSNIIDPIKMVFDRAVYGESWEDIISSEIFRQRDKSNNNSIGYFHQKIFQYICGCTVPANGTMGGWDVIVEKPEGYNADGANLVHKIYVEMKNKHNTMNGPSSEATYIKMQNQLLHDDDCVCFLVEVIAKRKQNIVWKKTVNGQKVSHARIRRVSMDDFYEIVTGDPNGFFKICKILPEVVSDVLNEGSDIKIPNDTVIQELRDQARKINMGQEDLSMLMAMYMLGFSSYNGFKDLA